MLALNRIMDVYKIIRTLYQVARVSSGPTKAQVDVLQYFLPWPYGLHFFRLTT